MKRFVTDDGPIEFALVDGYSVGDTLLEGVMFECRFTPEGRIGVNVQKECAEYFSRLNPKWLLDVSNFVNDPECDSFQAPTYGGLTDAWIEEGPHGTMTVTAPVDATGTVEADPENPGELLVTFPPGFLEAAGFAEGDNIVWEIHGDAAIIRKQ